MNALRAIRASQPQGLYRLDGCWGFRDFRLSGAFGALGSEWDQALCRASRAVSVLLIVLGASGT
eukprot:3854294-Alexandrium_andersonii.AAC.1